MSDQLERVFARPDEQLPPPEGHFQVIAATARKRRRRKATTLSCVLVAVASVTTGGGLWIGNRTVGPPETTGNPAVSGATSPAMAEQAGPPSISGTGQADGDKTMPSGDAVPPKFQPFSMSTVSSTSYVLGKSAGCQRDPCTTLTRSIDGGVSWRSIDAPKAALAGRNQIEPNAVRDIRFATQRNGWAFGGALYSTHNGGTSWERQRVDGTVLDLAVNQSRVYAIVARCDGSIVVRCSQHRLFRSETGSDDWQEVTDIADDTGTGGGVLSFGSGYGVARVGARTYSFSDESWKPSETEPCQAKRDQLNSVAASSSSAGLFAMCHEGAGTFSIRKASPYGEKTSWEPAGVRTLTLPVGKTVAFAAATQDTLLAATGGTGKAAATVKMSQDGGQTWKDASAVPPVEGGWGYLGATSANTLVALPEKLGGAMYTSSDGGQNWSPQTFE